MAYLPILCPYCKRDQVVKRGKTDTGKQRYRCLNPDCSHRSFVLAPAYKGRIPEIKQTVLEMSLTGSGIRDTARVLQISPTTVINELKKKDRCSPPSSYHS
jgi:transposase-like protein